MYYIHAKYYNPYRYLCRWKIKPIPYVLSVFYTVSCHLRETEDRNLVSGWDEARPFYMVWTLGIKTIFPQFQHGAKEIRIQRKSGMVSEMQSLPVSQELACGCVMKEAAYLLATTLISRFSSFGAGCCVWAKLDMGICVSLWSCSRASCPCLAHGSTSG